MTTSTSTTAAARSEIAAIRAGAAVAAAAARAGRADAQAAGDTAAAAVRLVSDAMTWRHHRHMVLPPDDLGRWSVAWCFPETFDPDPKSTMVDGDDIFGSLAEALARWIELDRSGSA